MMVRFLLFSLSLAVIVSIPTPAAAMPRTGRRVSGIVQMTNVQKRETEILRTDTGRPLRFVWINRTLFVANAQVMTATILKPGAKVEVIYHQPLIGRSYVTKVTLLSALDQNLTAAEPVAFLRTGTRPRWKSVAIMQRFSHAARKGAR